MIYVQKYKQPISGINDFRWNTCGPDAQGNDILVAFDDINQAYLAASSDRYTQYQFYELPEGAVYMIRGTSQIRRS